MTSYAITYGARNETISLELADITDAVEIYNEAYGQLRDRQEAYLVLAAVHEGNYKKE